MGHLISLSRNLVYKPRTQIYKRTSTNYPSTFFCRHFLTRKLRGKLLCLWGELDHMVRLSDIISDIFGQWVRLVVFLAKYFDPLIWDAFISCLVLISWTKVNHKWSKRTGRDEVSKIDFTTDNTAWSLDGRPIYQMVVNCGKLWLTGFKGKSHSRVVKLVLTWAGRG